MVVPMSPEEVFRRLNDPSHHLLLLDVRELDERETAHIEPSLHIPMGEIAARIKEIPRDRELVVYCHGGTRSAMVAGYLEGQGHTGVANLTGGIDAWSRKVDPAVPRYG
ncbi:MAG: sulfurtransferase [Thermoplasmata archaeon]|nr:sulfurtransferase [Thermoplasmata archaeon]